MADAIAAPEIVTQKSAKELPKIVKYVMIQNHTAALPYSFQDANGIRSKLNPLGDQNIPNDDIITEDGKEKAIRYIAACSTIYVDEQIKQGYPRDYRFQNTDLIAMQNGELVIFPQEEPTKYLYIETTNRNGSNPKRKKNAKILFILDDAELKRKKVLDEDRLVTKAKYILYQIEEDEAKLRNVAAQLTFDMNADPSFLLTQLKGIAEKTPKLLIDAYNNDAGDIAGMVWDAIELHVIHFTGFSFEWSETKEKIALKMNGRQTEDNARKKLVDFLQSSEGDATRQLIETVVKERKK